MSNGITLLAQLVDATNDPALAASPSIHESAKDLGKLITRAQAAEDAAADVAAAASAGDPVLDQRTDRITKALNLRLQAAELLDDGDASERATDHLATLYPEGLAFTKASYPEQDAVMQRMVRQLKDADLTASVEELAGKKYVNAFKSVAKQYHAMVLAMGRVVPSTVDQRAVLIDMQALLVQHASRVLGELRDADPKSVARTRGLLAPIDNFRARNPSSGGARPPAPATPATPAAPAEDEDGTSRDPVATTTDA